jgi:hypothetical protein
VSQLAPGFPVSACLPQIPRLTAPVVSAYFINQMPTATLDKAFGDVPWGVFYVVAPDGLCYWFGERQPA